MQVADLMAGSVVTVGHDATVADAWSIMPKRQVRHLPVLDAGHGQTETWTAMP